MSVDFISIEPKLSKRKHADFASFFASVSSEVEKTEHNELPAIIRRFRSTIYASLSVIMPTEELELAFVKSALLDLLGTGWKIRIVERAVQLEAPIEELNDPGAYKNGVRRSHRLEREDQLADSSVREFVRRMESHQLTSKGWHSIFSVMRDGERLAKRLREVLSETDYARQSEFLRAIIDPYLEMVTDDGICSQTGLLLRDIWRYFRYTWVNSYKSLPGRSMSLLVRDRAAPNHPVIGIAALGSSVAQQRVRDIWIGWDQDGILERLTKTPNEEHARWLLISLEDLISGIYVKDLLAEGKCTRAEIERPSPGIIERLEDEGRRAISEHHLFPEASAHKASNKKGRTAANWEAQASTSLFRGKRCATLAKLLRIRLIFRNSGLLTGSSTELRTSMASSSVRNAVAQLVRLIKAQRLGIDMMDITVCGAIAPYNILLGGKLICMLLCSSEVVRFYNARYSEHESVIASSMAGRSVVRHPKLVLLGTTSLFGVGSSQYNRVRIPCERVGGQEGERVTYTELGRSEGYGSFHFGELTVSLGDTLLARRGQGRRVNSIFGEGVNPRMRKLREAFDYMHLPSDEILRHRNVRVVYGIALAKNFREVLLGLEDRAHYLIPTSLQLERTKQIADYWRERWLKARIGRPGILETVEQHTLTHPVRHGARVVLPLLDGEEQYLLDPS